MDVTEDLLVDFAPERSQLARLAPVATAPPVWAAAGAIAIALGLSLALALPPATTVRRGAVTGSFTPGDVTPGDDGVATAEESPRSFELFHLPAWHDEAAGSFGESPAEPTAVASARR